MKPDARQSNSPGPFKERRYRLEAFALNTVAAIIPMLPFEALAPLGRLLGSVGFLFDYRGRPTALENLKAAFGDRFDADERDRIARASYQNFARTMLCLFWSPRLNESNFAQYFRVEGLDNHAIHRNQSAPGIYFCFHFSNFEWLSHASAFCIRRGIIIAQKFKNPLIGPIFSRLRSTSGHEVIPQQRAIVRMLKVLKAGGKFGVLTDLSLDPRHGAVPIQCFGLWTAASPLTPALCQRTGAKLIPCECIPDDDAETFVMRYHPPLDLPADASDSQIAQACWDALEPSIRARPECWLWAYKQWRFRPSKMHSNLSEKPPSAYPAYSKTSSRFDRMLSTCIQNPVPNSTTPEPTNSP